jgi:hypothetical protein
MPGMAIFFFSFKIMPKISNPNFGKIGKSEVFIWILEKDFNRAFKKAGIFLKNNLWEINKMEAGEEITESSCLNDEQRKLFGQANSGNVVSQFFIVPIDQSRN